MRPPRPNCGKLPFSRLNVLVHRGRRPVHPAAPRVSDGSVESPRPGGPGAPWGDAGAGPGSAALALCYGASASHCRRPSAKAQRAEALHTGRPVSFGYDLNSREGPRASWPANVPPGPWFVPPVASPLHVVGAQRPVSRKGQRVNVSVLGAHGPRGHVLESEWPFSPRGQVSRVFFILHLKT